jgi:serine/threonine protein phosphatase PrpC
MALETRFWAATDVGKQRDHNEDNFLVDKKLNLFVVADGMGGHAAGEVASQIAVHELRTAVAQNADIIDRFAKDDQSTSPQDILTLMEHAVQAACSAIYRRGQAETEKRGMGTTCSALLVVGERGFIAHVGDSRIYLLRQGHVVQLTEDHSLLNELIKRGKVTRETIDSSPYRDYKNAVTRAVGVYESVQVDTFDFDALPGDCFLLCTDGLHHYLPDADIPQLLDGDVQQVTQRLVQLANGGGGHDNITNIVVHIEQPAPAQTAASAAAAPDRNAEYARKIDVLRRMPFFHDLDMKEIIRVVNLTEVRAYAPSDLIIAEGQAGDEMFIILTGKVRLHKGDAFITHLGPGSFVGELSLIDSQPRSASVSAEEASRALVLRRSDFIRLVKTESSLSSRLLWNVLQVVTARLRKTTVDLAGARMEADAVDLSEEVEAVGD